VYKLIQILSISLTAALLLTACGKKEQAMPAAAPAAAEPTKPAEPPVQQIKEENIEFALNCLDGSQKYIAISVNGRTSFITDNLKDPYEIKVIELTKIEERADSYQFKPNTSTTFRNNLGERSVDKVSINRQDLDLIFWDYPDGKPYYASNMLIARLPCSVAKDKLATLDRVNQLLDAKVKYIQDQEEKSRKKDDELRKKAKI
jgi:hypothetical protein